MPERVGGRLGERRTARVEPGPASTATRPQGEKGPPQWLRAGDPVPLTSGSPIDPRQGVPTWDRGIFANEYKSWRKAWRTVCIQAGYGHADVALPAAVEQRSLTTLREKLIKIWARAHHSSVLPTVLGNRATAGRNQLPTNEHFGWTRDRLSKNVSG